jgi:predicted ATPase/DNA-binding SARP family transcriptional activator
VEASGVEFGLLGPLVVHVDGAPVRMGGAKQNAVLALLLVGRRESVSVDRLLEALWGDRPPPSAKANLQNYVSFWRKALGPDAILKTSTGYRLRACEERVDSARFERMCEVGRGAMHAGRRTAAARALRGALGLWRGDALEEFAYEDWARGEASRLEELRLGCLEDAIEAELELGRHEELVPDIEQLVASEPLRERPRRQLMLALYRSGRQPEALEVFDAFRRLLDEQLGLEPSAELRRLHTSVIRTDRSLALAHAPQARGSALPAPASSFLGRALELEAVLALLGVGTRLVTLTGPGGIGKTRLALEAARSFEPELDEGARWVPLAAVREPALVLSTISEALGTSDPPASNIGDRTLLLLLDNYEQVIESAPDLSALLRACPNLTLLVTSRERLGIEGEREYLVPELADDEAVSLFCERSGLAATAEVEELCRRLEGIPLAIELAAARAKLFTPAQLVDRLAERLDLLSGGRDAGPRQRTLRATIAWSHDLLSAGEQRLFRSLSILPGGCTYDVAERVCAADADTLQSLLDKSLLRRVETDLGPRFRMLETIREFAAERFADAQASAGTRAECRRVLERASAWLLELAARVRQEVIGPEAAAWKGRMDPELANVRAELERTVGTPHALRLAAEMSQYWDIAGHALEARRWLERALTAPDDAEPRSRARCLRALANFLHFQRDPAAAQHAEAALGLFRELGEEREASVVLCNLGAYALDQGDYGAAERHLLEALALGRSSGHDRVVATINHNLGDLHLRSDSSLAVSYFEQTVELCDELGDADGAMLALAACARAHLELQDVPSATEKLVRSLRLCAGLQALHEDVVDATAHLALAVGATRRAAVLLCASEAARDAHGHLVAPHDAPYYDRLWQELRAGLDDSELTAACEEGAELHQAGTLALALEVTSLASTSI